MKTRLYILPLLLLASSPLLAQSHEVIYKGSGNGGHSLVALSVREATPRQLTALASRYDAPLILVYRDWKGAASAEPLAVFENGELKAHNADPSRSADGPTIGQNISNAYRTGGRVGAICRDGWRSSATGRGACSHHGGVSRWLHSKVKDSNKIIATICANHRLQSATNCGQAGVLARIQNRKY